MSATLKVIKQQVATLVNGTCSIEVRDNVRDSDTRARCRGNGGLFGCLARPPVPSNFLEQTAHSMQRSLFTLGHCYGHCVFL
jgi:hypothetical protein